MTSNDVRQRAQQRVGQTLRGKWRIDAMIGVGGMAAVYSATHRNGKRGAVKILHAEMNLMEEVRNRFLREGYLANKVDHPGVVSVLDDDQSEDGSVFLVMELLEGESLDLKLARSTRLGEAEAVPIIADVLDVLASAHQKGIVHRDLKPDNVFVTHRRQVKVLDFGIARMKEAAQQGGGTQTGSLMGTPNFMPPEQALGDWNKVDGRTDIWAIGATLFAMLAGRAVHLGDNPNKILLSAMTTAAPPLLSVAPHVSPRVAAVVDRALAFDRDQRWPLAQEMREALLAAMAQQQTLPVAQHGGGRVSSASGAGWAAASPGVMPYVHPTQAHAPLPSISQSTPRISSSPNLGSQPGQQPVETLNQAAVASNATGDFANQSKRKSSGGLMIGLTGAVIVSVGVAGFAAWKTSRPGEPSSHVATSSEPGLASSTASAAISIGSVAPTQVASAPGPGPAEVASSVAGADSTSAAQSAPPPTSVSTVEPSALPSSVITPALKPSTTAATARPIAVTTSKPKPSAAPATPTAKPTSIFDSGRN